MKSIIIFLIAFICVCLLNSTLKSYVQDTLFIEELLDVSGILLRLIIAFALTSSIISIMNKRKSKISDTQS